MSGNDWYRAAAREFSYFTMTEIIKAYKSMDEKYDHAFYNVLFHLENNVLTMIRKKSEMKYIVDYIESLSEEYIVEQLQTTANKFEELKETLDGFELTADSWKNLMDKTRDLWAYNMFCIYFGYAAERDKIKDIRENNYELVVKVRNEISDLGIVENFLREKSDEFDLTELSFEEIGRYLEYEELPSGKELVRRKEEILIFMKDLEPERVPEEEIAETLEKYVLEDDYSDKKELKGRVAFKGDIKGKARIVMKKKDLQKIQEGDILITTMTSPEYVPQLSKVAGIVTDYGGATSHAAIISREMKIPCIIATEIATKVFKDGDLVKIDSEKRTVKKS